MLLVDLAIRAPWCGLVPHGDGTLHAVTMEALIGAFADEPLTAACGVEGVKVLPVPLCSENPAPWPPAVKGLPDGFTRCMPCQKATGNKRPACRFVRPADSDGGEGPHEEGDVNG